MTATNSRRLSLLVLGTALAIGAGFAIAACGGSSAAGDSRLRPLVARDGSHRRPLVPRGDLLVGKRSGRLVILERSGKLIRRVPRFVAPYGPQGVELAPDRRHAFVSVLTSERPARVYAVELA